MDERDVRFYTLSHGSGVKFMSVTHMPTGVSISYESPPQPDHGPWQIRRRLLEALEIQLQRVELHG